ncbi:hypothetical protein M9Y10_027990 [Tritrichomonas musculus]|uniref:HTH CENPB-type domain-containing protein n=1 Tax=Tritrichomonas musculus TaxID=1915356 RepID=A0ABR2KIW4_9EUKA
MQACKVPRSRTVLMMNAAEIPEIANWNWNDILPPVGDHFYDTFDNQVNLLRSNTIIRIIDLCKLFKISTATFYILYPANQLRNLTTFQSSPGRPTLVSKEDENSLLEYIKACQCEHKCIRPREAPEWLEHLIFVTKGQNITLDRFWFHRFKERYSEKLRIL